ncbi:AMIN domain-containing protein [Nodularia harveyana UHCC-0300]|uniref:AMIN domain-containing protein n=1 Tax=Nodularia harveyana UHCC-0300 TaxID=2974287 RepID=A0ABU5UHE7_9CYAN|nr:AMIN domain-containing protein [Nodularia harveyana]MEA5582987.1 AMIN domain-containing protein [Nodularia harveyana UHCC-0300]
MYKGLSIRQFSQYSQRFLALYAVMSLQTGISVAAPVAKLDNWRFDPETIKLEINLSANTTPEYFYLAEPPRLVVDLPNTQLGYVPTVQNYWGAIQRIRVSQLNETVTRIVLDLAAGNFVDPNQIQLQLVSRQNPTRWVLSPRITSYTPPAQNGNFLSRPNLPPTNYLQLPSTLPLTTPNPQQPFVTVPPLTPRNSPLPPGSFPQQPDVSNIRVIEFGQPLPKTNY